MRRVLLTAMILLSCGLSCKLDSGDFSRSEDRPELSPPERTPPEADSPAGRELYQLLYSDEVGEGARELGQRARMLVWLQHVGLREEQLVSLRELLLRLREDAAADRAAIEAAGRREAEAYGPIYEDVVLAYAGGRAPSQDALASLASALGDAHRSVRAEEDPREAHHLRLRASIREVRTWIEGLDAKQRARVGTSRFFLRKRLGPLVNAGDYEAVVGTLWDAGDFNSLRYTSIDPETQAMDLGGLWSAEARRTDASDHLGKLQLAALTWMALTEPGLLEAIEVRLGEREPLDFSRGESPG